MGSVLTTWWWGGDPDQPDPISGLSRRDIYQIQYSWKPVYAEIGNNGVELFKRLFRNDPETKTFFKTIKDMNEDQISANHQFRAHAINLMSSLHMAILNLEHPEVVVAMMNKLGSSHYIRHIKEKHFEEFNEVLVFFFINDLKLSEGVVESWARFVTFIYTNIFATLRGQ